MHSFMGSGRAIREIAHTEHRGGQHVDENEHPKGALLFILIYLALLAFMWTNMYLKLWTG